MTLDALSFLVIPSKTDNDLHHEVGPTALMSKLVTVKTFGPKIGDNQLLLLPESFPLLPEEHEEADWSPFLRMRGELEGVDATEEAMDDMDPVLKFEGRV